MNKKRGKFDTLWTLQQGQALAQTCLGNQPQKHGGKSKGKHY